MKTKTTLASTLRSKATPDFSGRPKRISLTHITAVKEYGKLVLRPIRLEDEEEMIRFHEALSEESIYMRYFEFLGLDRRTSHERLVRICTNTPESYAIVVERPATRHRPAAILAVGRLTKSDESDVAIFDTLVVEGSASARLCKILLEQMIKVAGAFGFKTLVAELLVADHETLNLCRTLGFHLRTFPDDGLVLVTLDL